MTYTIDHDSIQSTDAGYRYSQGEEVSIAPGVLVSSTETYGVVSTYANSRLVNHGHIMSAIGGTPDLLTLHLDNTGVMRGRQTGIAAPNAGGTIHNSGLIEGTTFMAIDGSLSGNRALAIFNSAGGIIRGDDKAVNELGHGRISIDNHGTIVGDINLATDGGNIIRNSGRIAGDIFFGDGADHFNGLGGKSGAVRGGKGNDTLAGGNLADLLGGGAGNDVLTGRGGKDKFVFGDALDPVGNVDTIRDFTVNVDTIQLDYAAFSLPIGALAAARFHAGPRAHDASDRIIYDPNTGALYSDHDGRGGDPQVKFAQLAKHLPLDHEDFLVISIGG